MSALLPFSISRESYFETCYLHFYILKLLATDSVILIDEKIKILVLGRQWRLRRFVSQLLE
jgi:hypothetical protein